MSNIPKSFQDYDENDPEIEFRKKRFRYWELLKKVRKEYMETLDVLTGQFDAYDFEEYVENNYGFKLNTMDGNITDKFEIVDEKKYIIFILKFG
jgi:hypothetical protein